MPHDYEVLGTEQVYDGHVISLRLDTVAMPGGGESVREVVHHGGAAERWSLLTTHHPSPGFCDEKVLLYLAEGLSEVARPDGFVVEHEELDMTIERVPLEEAVQWVFDGTVRNSLAAIGLLAAARVRARPTQLRPLDAT
jgi:hypothetical protein